MEERTVLAVAELRRDGARRPVAVAVGLSHGKGRGLRWDHANLGTGDVRM
jgi:hypothetical protein